MKTTTIMLLVFIYCFSFFAGFIIGKQYESVFTASINNDEVPNASAIFNCDDDKFIIADFYNGRVDLSLSDRRVISLPHAISASGARYANSAETFVFWNKGDTAFIDENDQRTFENCITNGSK
ncbi:MAG: MliC family protein [Candidatus Paceibacterota bacterium]|jgi:membrane-bound inhibitor of C-type lysozyme